MFFIDWIKSLFKRKENVPVHMKYLIAGLGNMHPDYNATRHNIGFEIVDFLANELGISFKNDQLADVAEGKYKGRSLILIKPSTYMNLSGKSVRYWMQKKKVKKENLVVIVDDKNLDFGQIRLRKKGSDGGHNGLKDVNNFIGADYARLKVGIGNNFPKGRQVDFVLGKWSDKEVDGLRTIIPQASDTVKSFCAIGIDRAMNEVNKRISKS